MHDTELRGARRVLLAAGLFAALVVPFAVAAQDDEDDDLPPETVEAMLRSPGPAEAKAGSAINGWLFRRGNGVCRVYSFDDPLVIQANPADPSGTRLQFQVIDGGIPEAHGSKVAVTVLLREAPDEPFEEIKGVAEASRNGATPAYLLPVPLEELIARYPDGFQLVLLDKDGYQIVESDTQGSHAHFASLKACTRPG